MKRLFSASQRHENPQIVVLAQRQVYSDDYHANGYWQAKEMIQSQYPGASNITITEMR
ncbi:MAG: hypothetical protein ABSG50_00580 [Opitutaceae bacterium]|jgi:hypothetical protein